MNLRFVLCLCLASCLATSRFAHAEAPDPANPAPPPGPSYIESSAATRDVGERYFAAYVDKRWDDLAPLLAERAQFVDPTAEAVFGKVEMIGKSAVMENFRANYANLSMQFTAQRVIHSGAYAVFRALSSYLSPSLFPHCSVFGFFWIQVDTIAPGPVAGVA